VSLGSPLQKSVIFSFVHSYFKNRPTVAVIIIHTNHTTYLAKVGYFNLVQNPSVQVLYEESSLLQLASMYRLIGMLAKQRMT